MDDLSKSLRISAAGMRAQGTRLRIITENLANADSTAVSPDGEPYRRKTVSFRNTLDRSLGAQTVQVNKVSEDTSPFVRKYDPGNPAADASGYVQTANVNPLIEMADMREAQRTYEANINVIKAAKTMLQQTIDVLR
ncbi:MAG: flagellar basal body rod protein FlgC [Rhodospirillales bacterium]